MISSVPIQETSKKKPCESTEGSFEVATEEGNLFGRGVEELERFVNRFRLRLELCSRIGKQDRGVSESLGGNSANCTFENKNRIHEQQGETTNFFQ